MRKISSFTLVTGNKNKLAEYKAIIGNRFSFTVKNIDLPELQGEPVEICKAKCKVAFEKLKTPLIVEDASLCFNAYNGLPGVYIKWFSNKVGNIGIYKMLDGFEDKTAYAQCIISYMSEELKEPIAFVGQTNGRIVEPRGAESFAWDQIFVPDGFEQTYSQLPPHEKHKISHRAKALNAVMNYFDDPQNYYRNNLAHGSTN